MGDAALVVVPMRREDLDEVMEIERRSFAAPWPAALFLGELDEDGRHVDLLREGEGGRILAFVNYWLVGDEAHVMNLATRPEARRRGLASLLLDHVARVAVAEGAAQVALEVRRSNRGAVLLYRRHGYRFVGVRPRYYEDNGEDALLMTLDLPSPGATIPPDRP